MKEFRRSVWIGFIWSIVFGTMLHFLYGWTGENRVVGLYAAVSESTWEHLKLLFFPVLLYTVWNISGWDTAGKATYRYGQRVCCWEC